MGYRKTSSLLGSSPIYLGKKKNKAWSLDPELDFCSSESTSSKKKTLGDPAVECLLHSLRLDVHGGNETRMIQT